MKSGLIGALLAIALAGLVGCETLEAQDAEIGCGLNPNASPKCPNRPPAPPSGAGSVDAAVIEIGSSDAAIMDAEADMGRTAVDAAFEAGVDSFLGGAS